MSALVEFPESEDYDSRVRRERAALLSAVDGIIADGLADRNVTEVLVNPDGSVWFDKLYGPLERQVNRDIRPGTLKLIINAIAGVLKKKVLNGILEGELILDGSRIQAWLPPVSPQGPAIAIRKHRRQGVDGWPALRLDDYFLPTVYSELLHRIAEDRLNILIVGSTASGKTTFAGAFLNLISTIHPADRIVTVEDASELRCESECHLALHTVEHEDKSKCITQRMLVKTGMRARPDRLILSEVRDEAAVDMIMGLTTGHAGFSTVHGGSCQHGLTRVQQLTRLAGETTIAPDMVSDAIDYVLLMKRRPYDPLCIDRPTTLRYVADIAKVKGYRDSRYDLESIPIV